MSPRPACMPLAIDRASPHGKPVIARCVNCSSTSAVYAGETPRSWTREKDGLHCRRCAPSSAAGLKRRGSGLAGAFPRTH